MAVIKIFEPKFKLHDNHEILTQPHWCVHTMLHCSSRIVTNAYTCQLERTECTSGSVGNLLLYQFVDWHADDAIVAAEGAWVWLNATRPNPRSFFRWAATIARSTQHLPSCYVLMTERRYRRADWKRVNPLTPKISLVTLFTVCHTILITLVRRIWYWIN